MKNKVLFLLSFLLLSVVGAMAQRPFTEGTVKYKVEFKNKVKATFTGTYIFTFKNGFIRKELKLSNGFENVELINTNDNTVYSLRSNNGRRYAIQLSMDEMSSRQEPYKGFTMLEDPDKEKVIAGKKAMKTVLVYKNGSKANLYVSLDWYPDKTITYERFPDARFLPLEYTYSDDVKGFTMHMVAESVSQSPVENAIFRIPADYKMISNEEYKLLSQQ